MIKVLISATAILAAFATAPAQRSATDHVRLMQSLETPEATPWLTTDTTRADYRKYIDFLYKYMALPDRMDYPRGFYMENVAVALRAKAEMPWGGIVPEREFMHFVLPVRVNNENLDRHRRIFYNELKDRVKGKSMYDAILEINRWCREHVTYQPSDSRTHSPLASIGQAIGRCGEESTYLVAALRSVGIPARQVYTPRWAHTDDNHAWVEAWADGQWYFLGACEPEPVLNLGWFNAPASRGMLMTTRVTGKYDGPEEVLVAAPDYTIINVTENYAKVNPVTVTVTDSAGNPVTEATVDFRLYNYAELYPIATKQTDANGHASLLRGEGDLIVWASKDGAFNYTLCKGSDRNVTLRLQNPATSHFAHSINIVPPKGGANLPDVSDEQREENIRFCLHADELRNAYITTFATPQDIKRLAQEIALPEAALSDIMVKARGNHPAIAEFLRGTELHRRPMALRMLNALSDKDLTDISITTLRDALDASPLHFATDFDMRYIVCPRAEREFLTPHREALKQQIKDLEIDKLCPTPSAWAGWIEANIADTFWQPGTVRMSALSTLAARKGDIASRSLLFVAGARAMGWPARIDLVTSKAQYATPDHRWHDAFLSKQPQNGKQIPDSNQAKGLLKLTYSTTDNVVAEPRYYSHFTLQKIVDGRPQLLEYPEDATWQKDFADGVELDAGLYQLVTGQRLADGTVLTNIEQFEIAHGGTREQPLLIRHDSSAVQVIGNFNSENLYHDKASDTDKSLLSTTGRGYYIIALVKSSDEPSNHLLKDVADVAAELDKTGCKAVFLADSEDDLKALDAQLSRMPAMPANVVWGTDIDGTIRKELTDNLHFTPGSWPILVIADTFNRVVFAIQGYNIGAGQQLLHTLRKISE